MFAVTIDGASSRDLDDAIWCEKTEFGYRLNVLIANVADSVLQSSPEDSIASERQFSIYSGARGCVKPMLPRHLSEKKLSLIQEETRPVISICIELTAACDVSQIAISTASFKNLNRLDYEMIPGILDNKEHSLHDGMCLMRDVAEQLLANRRKSGSLVIYDVVSGWSSDENGTIRKLSDIERNIGYVIVQELMILANSQLSEFCLKNNIPIMYRNHKVNIAAPSVKSVASDIETAFAAQNESGMKLIARRLSLFASKAVMSNSVGGHYGLNLPAYAWFTSPIRRYPDLVNQRNILAYLRGESFVHSHESIDSMADAYNQKVIAVDAETSEFHAKRAQEKATKVLVSESLSHVDSVTFYQSIKSFLSSDAVQISEAMQAEVLRRAQSNLLEVKTLALLFSQGWRGFSDVYKREIIQELMNNLPLSISISNVMSQKYDLSEPQYEFSEDGQDHRRRFVCTASVIYREQHLLSKSQISHVKKASGQYAMWDLLNQMAGVGNLMSVQHEQQAVKPETLTALRVSIDVSTISNPVGHLQEFCQKRKIGMPMYEYQKIGQDHLPQFQATVSVMFSSNQLTVTGSAATTKKEAARTAAALWLERHCEV